MSAGRSTDALPGMQSSATSQRDECTLHFEDKPHQAVQATSRALYGSSRSFATSFWYSACKERMQPRVVSLRTHSIRNWTHFVSHSEVAREHVTNSKSMVTTMT